MNISISSFLRLLIYIIYREYKHFFVFKIANIYYIMNISISSFLRLLIYIIHNEYQHLIVFKIANIHYT